MGTSGIKETQKSQSGVQNVKALTGIRRENLILIKRLPCEKRNGYRATYSLMYCEYCGKTVKRRHDQLRTCKSCGCSKTRLSNESNTKHGDSGKRLYNIWNGMLSRCHDERAISYKNYGARGITVCDGFKDYKNFKKWALLNGFSGGLEIDRIDNDGDYTPENSRFVTRIENRRKKRNTKLSMEKAKNIREMYKTGNYSQKQIAKIYGTCKSTIWNVINFKQWYDEGYKKTGEKDKT